MDPPQPKLRLMVSYNGQITPRPNDNRLLYAGGESRIVAVDRRTTITTFKSHLSTSLFQSRPFHLKYQLPTQDLDSLISVSNDEDLLNMIEEHDAVKPARIRLFLFPVKSGSGRADPDPDPDPARKEKGTGAGAGEGLLDWLQESMVLETNSSFGSTSSLVSMSNLPPIGVQCEDGGGGGVGVVDRNIRLPSSTSFER